MRRFAVLGAGVFLFLIIGTAFLGCGGGGGTAGTAASIKLFPGAVSLNRGATAQVAVQALDASNNIVATPTLAFHSDDSAITISSSGLICAGQWDANFIQCLTTDSSNNLLALGTANITATTPVNNKTLTSSAVVVTDHEPIDAVQVCLAGNGAPQCPAPPTACVSQNGTAQYTAMALSHDAAACQRITSSPCGTPCVCAVPPQTIGSVNWTVSPAQVATADAIIHAATDPVVVTAAAPGRGSVTGSVGVALSTVSGSAPFTTCPVASIHVHQKNKPAQGDTDTSFTAPVGGTVPLVADVLDSNGVQLTSTLSLTWLTSQPALTSISPATAQGATVEALAPGTASITAVCLPQSCNVDFLPIYSDDVVTANITGTVDSTVLVTTSTAPASATSSNNIVPIDTATNAVGTAFALPSNVQVNSMVMTPVGNPAFLGTACAPGSTTGTNGTACSGLLRFDPTVSTVPNPTPTITGRVLATDGTRVVLSDPDHNQTLIALAAGPSIERPLSQIPNATAAAFAVDGSKIYIVAGSNLYVYSPGLPLQLISSPPLGGPATTSSQAVAFFATGAMAYVADAAGDEAVATCEDAIQTASTAPVGSPTHIAAIPNGTGMVDANSLKIDEIDISSNGACPPVITPTPPVPITTSTSGFTAHQLLVTPNSQLAIILADEGVLVYKLGSNQTPTLVSLGSGVKALSGGVTPDSANLYVGASDGRVHRVDLKTLTDAQTPITVAVCPSGTAGCNPDFVVVRPVTTVATLSSIAVTPATPTQSVNGSAQSCPAGAPAGEVCFTATGTFSDKTTRDLTSFVVWVSSNPLVAIVGVNTSVSPPLAPGEARALATGSTTISATSAGVSGSTTLTVVQ